MPHLLTTSDVCMSVVFRLINQGVHYVHYLITEHECSPHEGTSRHLDLFCKLTLDAI